MYRQSGHTLAVNLQSNPNRFCFWRIVRNDFFEHCCQAKGMIRVMIGDREGRILWVPFHRHFFLFLSHAIFLPSVAVGLEYLEYSCPQAAYVRV